MFEYEVKEAGFVSLGVIGECAAGAANADEGVGKNVGVCAEEGRRGGAVEAALKPDDSAENEAIVGNASSEAQGLFRVEEAS